MSRCPLTAVSLSLYAFFFGLLISAAAQNNHPAQKAAQESSPPSTASQSEGPANATPPSSQPKADYSKEALVIEKTQIRYRFENDGTGRKEGMFRVRIQSEAGVQAFGQLRLGYNSANDRLDIGYVRVIKPDGSVITAGPDAIQDLTGPVQQIAPVYTDYREKHVTVPGLRPGDVLEAQINTTFHTPMAPGQFWMQQDFNKLSVVLDEQLEVDIPATRAVKVKNKPGMDPKITEENGRRIYRWSSSHLESPSSENDKDKGKKKKKKADEIPDVQMSTFSSWEEVGRWFSDLEKDRRKPSREVRAKADELTKGLSSDLEKTEALYNYVSQNFRYVSLSLGLARFQPQSAADVLHNQYGDCKDKNTLLAALLEAEGLHSSTVLINSFRKLDPDVPSPSQFNHAITMLPLGKDELWMDTTTEVAPFRLLAYSLRKKQALVIPQDGPARLEETPADPPMPDEELTEVTGKVDESGRLDGTVTYTLRGDAELRQRITFRHLAAAQWQKYIEGLNKSLGGDVSDIKLGDVTATRQPFVISYRVSKGNFIDWEKKKLELKLPLAVVSLSSVSSNVDEEADPSEASSEEPFKIGPAHQHTYRLTLELAPRFSPSVPIPTQVERDYAAYKSTYKWEGRVLTSERTLTLRQNELPPSRADDYRAFRRAVLADNAQQVTIESTVGDDRSIPEGMKAADLIKSGNEARKNGDYTLAINLLNRAVETEPKNKSAWNDLGLAYLDSREDALAINAFQKQIEINPYHEFAYNNLGRVYLRQRNYEEAEKCFRKQLEVDPLDKYAHGNLGIVFLETKKFADAVPELEKAASLNPNDAEAQVRLGNAYLNLDQDDKAMAAFDKALKISANASIWNSTAYDLSLKGAHLDVAQNYAESAISSTAAALRNVSLAQVSQHQLRHSAALPSYWDTLGWIAFARGDIDKAERYVSAAWQLNGLAEEADHLGQIYEKKGQKEQAIHLYALALNSRRPELETRGRLAVLAGGDDKADTILEKFRGEPEKIRTISVPNASKQEGKADFYLLLSNSSGSDAQIETAQFISGDEKLKTLTAAIATLNYHQALPEATPVKIVRRGTVTCAADSKECSLVLALPQDVRFAE